MDAKELLKLAKNNGWEVVSQKGSHIKIRNVETNATEIIPYHGSKDVSIGVANKILKKLGLK